MSILYIATQGARLQARAGQYVVAKGDEELSAIPQAAVECIALLGYVQVTTQAVHQMLADGVPLLYLSRGGKFLGILQPGFPKNAAVRLAQYEASLDDTFSVAMAREVVACKLWSGQVTLRRWGRNGWLEDGPGAAARLAELEQELAEKATVQEMLGVEAIAAKTYFARLGQSLPPPFAWQGRSRQPPRDPVNALLSLTYMLTTGEAVSTCYASGLDPFIGFLHQLDYGRPSLALDILEPLRAMYCDHFVMRMLQEEQFGTDDFQMSEEQGCRLRVERFRPFLTAYQEFADSGSGLRTPLKSAIQRLARTTVEAVRTRRTPAWKVELGAKGEPWTS